ncbi:MAG: ABC transporter permease subunit [Aigarchaeota archaeon]|nr:ABC transporter permease subunit [Candidatus Pelearchaeum maunauluense]
MERAREIEVLKLYRVFRGRKEYAISLLALAVAWEIASYIFPPYAVPSWSIILKTLISLDFTHAYITVIRVLLALAAAFAVGFLLAVIMYLSRRIERYILPLVNLVMAVPAICWVLFAILWFKEPEFRIFFVLVAVCGPGFLIDILDGMKNIPRHLREMLVSFRPSKNQLVRKLILPAIVPSILTTWKINLGLAVRVVTVAELVGTISGIGYALNFALGNLSLAEIFAWSLVLVTILLSLQGVVYMLEARLLKWR